MAKNVISKTTTLSFNHSDQVEDYGKIAADYTVVQTNFDSRAAETLTALNTFIDILQASSTGSFSIGHNSVSITADNVGDALEENRLEIAGKSDKTNVLELDNTSVFTPTADYNPSTKKYVDETVAGVVVGQVPEIDQLKQYITPDAVVGTEVQITSTGTSERIFLDIQTIVTGGNVTINKNGNGAKPLLNEDDSNVQELGGTSRFVEVVEDGINFILVAKGETIEDIETFSDNFTTTDNVLQITGQATQDTGAGTVTFAPASTYNSTVVTGGTSVTAITTDIFSSEGDRIDDTNEVTNVVDATITNPNFDTWDETLTGATGTWLYPVGINGKIYVQEGTTPQQIWAYDIATDTWDYTLATPSANWQYPVGYNGKIYAKQFGSPYNLWVYDIATDTWDETLSAPSQNYAYLCELNGKIYARGSDGSTMLEYDIATDTWDETLASASGAWDYPVSYNNKIYVDGSNSIWAYDIATDTWDETLASPSGEWSYTTEYNGKIYVRSNTPPYPIWSYDIATDTWDETLSAPSEPWTYATSVGTDIYVRNNTVTSGIFSYDALESISQYDLTLTNAVTVAPDDVLTIYPKHYPNQSLKFNQQTFTEDVEYLISKIEQVGLVTAGVVGNVTNSNLVTVDTELAVGDKLWTDGVNEITGVLDNLDGTYDLTLTNIITVLDGDLLPISIFQLIINNEQAEFYKLNGNEWRYRLDTKDTTLDIEIVANEGTITSFNQNQVF